MTDPRAMLGLFPATSPYALTVTQANVFEAMRPRFLDTFGGAGFYRFEIDLDSDGVVLAHEIGHASGWADIFSSGSDQLSPLLRREMLPCDWNNGTGGRFYEYLFNQWNLVDRLLMHGTRTGAQCDIPLGMVEGLTSRKEYGFVNVGCSQGFMTRSPRSR